MTISLDWTGLDWTKRYEFIAVTSSGESGMAMAMRAVEIRTR